MVENRTKIGTIISMDIPQIAGLLSSVGFDFLFIDLEHGTISHNTINALVIAKTSGAQVFIRIAEISEQAIKYALDIGCDGIIAPRVESLAEVQMLLDYSFYPPAGKRSVGFTLASNYGYKGKEYIKNFAPIILPQVESVKGLEIAEEIAAVNGVTGIFLGPYDLSMSLGVPGQFDTEIFKNAYNKMRGICTKYNKIFAIFAATAEDALKEVQSGADIVVAGSDANLIMHMYAGIIKQLAPPV
jgi:2-keto-3-deoxy-L-rhamnonate aldolase RhmA